jgi:pyrroline-5-carboxylate reductase
MTVITPLLSSTTAELDRLIIITLFSSIGRCRFLDEKHFDACTAVCGTGPAFACIFLEAMAEGGVMMGLPKDEALELAAQCKMLSWFPHLDAFAYIASPAVQGAARMVLQLGVHPAQIKDQVTSKPFFSCIFR